MPVDGELDLTGLDISPDNMKELMCVDTSAWSAEIPDIEKHFSEFGDRLPERLSAQLKELRSRLGNGKNNL
jgi:phosphoenolpyruvate carboxykinase (GTP)